tara:strand:+ start:452 stop:646 length:195 start_codon:yes stop_codon:yes gene_type:complete
MITKRNQSIIRIVRGIKKNLKYSLGIEINPSKKKVITKINIEPTLTDWMIIIRSSNVEYFQSLE